MRAHLSTYGRVQVLNESRATFNRLMLVLSAAKYPGMSEPSRQHTAAQHRDLCGLYEYEDYHCRVAVADA